MSWVRAVIFAALFIFSTVPSAQAQDVTLISPDGKVEISGVLLGFDGEYYRLDTIYGELTVDGSSVRCEGPGCPNLEDYVANLTLSGEASVGRVLLPALIETFAQSAGLKLTHEDTAPTERVFIFANRDTEKVVGVFAVRSTNTDDGFADLLADQADIVMAQREIRSNEAKLAQEAGLGDLNAQGRSRVLALDAFVPIVATDNPLASITMGMLSRVVAGKITNWAELGGPDAPINVHMLDEKSGLGQAAVDQLLTPVGANVDAGAERHPNNLTLVQAVARDPFGLGLASNSGTRGVKPVPLSGQCGFLVPAERNSVKTEDYPLTAPVFLYVPARRLPKLARDFLTFTRSLSAQLVTRRAGYTDQAPELVPIDVQGNRFANAIAQAGQEVALEDLQRMVQVLRPMKRLTTTFRFETGSTRLDAQSRSNVAQLAQAIEAGQYDGRRLIFVGFSDGEGPASANLGIALRRAEAVRTAVQSTAETASFDRLKLEVDAFGEAMPMACDDSAWGRQVNRRVEVWVQ
jgi:phosphate transport system substrate-binding protein